MKHYRQARASSEKIAAVVRILRAFFEMSNHGLTSLDSWPSVEVSGISLQINRAYIDLTGLCDVWPSLAHEWSLLHLAAAVPLQNYPGNHNVLLADFLCFLQERAARSENCDPGHWLVTLRNTLSQILAQMFELHVWNLLVTATVKEEQIQIKELRHASGYRFRAGTFSKKQLLDRLEKAHGGSHETMLEILSEQRGMNAILQTVSNKMYDESAAGLFRSSLSVCLSWDGATYAGHSVNIGTALDCQHLFAAYMPPVVDISKKKSKIFVVKGLGWREKGLNGLEKGFLKR